MYQIIKPILFRIDPEKAHYFTVSLFKFALSIPILSSLLKKTFQYEHPILNRNVAGLAFKNPVGLAAGFDKDGKFLNQMSHVGFGFLEIGTVTPRPQIGNDKPRLFRLPQDKGLINRMGFNNEGVDALVERIKNFDKKDLIIGGNIGKNKVTPNENAVDDYLICFQKLHDYVDYFVVNVSSPNTPGLRALQDKKPLLHILSTLKNENNKYRVQRPIFLKIAPDLTNDQLDDIIDIVQQTNIQGVIATNTTISRDNLITNLSDIEKIGNGGLSGKPVNNRSTQVIKYLHTTSNGSFDIIGVGGICSPHDAKEKLDAGAKLIQIYSGMIYSGPTLVKSTLKSLVANSK